jgi:AcrR family transcriptional regulator
LTGVERSFKMLNMRSTAASDEPVVAPDRTTPARIRDAAIACFADAGVAGTSVRTIAAAAEVSPGLVIHHFGSKDGLRVACDQHVAALVREHKTEAAAAGPGLDPVAALRRYDDGPPLLRYLARTLVDGSPHVAELVDEMVADATEYMQVGVRTGQLRPTGDPRGRAAVLTLWSLGALVLHEHAERLLGADLAGDPQRSFGYLLPALDILGRGVITEAAYERAEQAFAEAVEEEQR